MAKLLALAGVLALLVAGAVAHKQQQHHKKADASRSPNENGFFLSNYFPNWAQYREGDFAYTPQQMQPAMSDFKYVVYAFAWANGGCDGCTGSVIYDFFGQCQFSNMSCAPYASGDINNPVCPEGAVPCTGSNFTILSPEPKDPQFYQQIIAMKQQGQKILLSVGGWNFPSSIFSTMVSKPEYRQSFIQSAQQFMDQYGFDGIDIDWEFWCSGPRMNYIKIDNQTFHDIYDVGGKCPDDGQNLLTFVQEMRQAFGADKMITLATQADLGKMVDVDIASVSEYIDYWHIMDYDYSVSDLPEMCGDSPCFANFTAPNQPLYAVKDGEIPAHQPPFPSSFWSVNYTIQGYIARGAPKEQLVLGLTFYGHHWYIPDVQNWQQFGVPAQISGKCYGPFQQTYGAWPGRRARLCGLLIYSEIMSLIDPNNPAQNYFDPVTQSDIGYITLEDGQKAGEDLSGCTPAFVSWNSIKSLTAITKFAMEAGIAGVFAFDSSMDQFETGYPVVTALTAVINGGGSSNVCTPGSCNVCATCCKSYLSNQADCDACVQQEC